MPEAMLKSTPFDDIRQLLTSAPPADDVARRRAEARLSSFPGPKPVLGRLEPYLGWMASWQGKAEPEILRPLIAVFAGTHGVAEKFFDKSIVKVARKRVDSLSLGQAPVRGIAQDLGAAFKVYELGVDHPVPDLTKEATLSEEGCAAAIAFGMEVVAEGADIIALGNAGTGSATAAAAIAAQLYGGSAEYWAGAHDKSARVRIQAVEDAIDLHREMANMDPLTCLRLYGGRDIAGMVGAIIAARHQMIPVVLDGFVVCTAAAILYALDPSWVAHCCAGHVSAEPAHAALLERLDLTPIHELGLTLGDGTGAAMALSTLRASLAGYGTLTG